jgi:hypothetical protein
LEAAQGKTETGALTMANRTTSPVSTIDTSDAAYSAAITAAYDAYETYLRTGSMDDMHVWIKLDRKRADIFQARKDQVIPRMAVSR